MLSEDLIYVFQTRKTWQYCQNRQLATVFKEQEDEELTFNTVSSEGEVRDRYTGFLYWVSRAIAHVARL